MEGGEREGAFFVASVVDNDLSEVASAGILALLTLRCEPVKVREKVG